MAKRRGNDEGTIYFHEPSQRWTGQITVGRDPISGRPKRVTVYGATQKEVREKLNQERQRPRNEQSGQPLSVALDFWLGGHKARVDRATAIRYEQEVRPIKDYLGKLPLSQVTAMDVHNLYRWMEDQGHSRDKQRRAGVRLRQCLTKCVNIGLLNTNPALKVDLPRAVADEIRPMSREQVGRLLKAVEGHRYEALFWLALDTGARQGELWALTWSDVDLAAPEVFFNKSLQERSGKLRIKPPKTAKRKRRVSITRQTADRLAAHRAPSGAVPEDLVF
jgi:integrase